MAWIDIWDFRIPLFSDVKSNQAMHGDYGT